jgi:hypothetical protein
MSAKVAGGEIGGWMSKKRTEDWNSFHGQRKARGFLERPSAKRARYVIDTETS